ncbi:methylthioribulose-1-phosphate dehydratase [Stanieria cyanosphaera PCC 7437]|uniref:Methylthioribulose-1-phosphate dehydratase n=1 Tax=Stanieria cyanosphaera (strain ATCC 29371 / PCC 7437) TaxID=111780 RepID=K9XXW7_STAC7|nr:methylthioribulose 1-phosphate dehydratase [Stanieria cyanosphaera]AFZ37445.1 methylthioribulose-1-phosphate dehydratase [Stanieria cyanosphaera PCC 7437]
MKSDRLLTLITAARQFYQQGWMVGTAGNLSIRHDDKSFWITASGKSKGKLTQQDFVRVNLAGEVMELSHPDNRPSAETSIHQVIYTLFPEAQACYHVHSVEANLVSNLSNHEAISLPPLEMIKGLGVWQEDPQVKMSLFENYLEVPRIAQAIYDRFTIALPEIPALLIRNHGVTVWGRSPEETQNYLEIVEYIFRYILAARNYSYQ